MVPAVGAQTPAGAVDDLALAVAEARVAAQELALALAREEAEVLALGPAGDLEPRRGRELAHLGLGQLAEREAQPRERGGPQRGEHVGLVLGRVGRARRAAGPSPSSAMRA